MPKNADGPALLSAATDELISRWHASGWALKCRWYWPEVHNDVVQKLLRRARKGCRIVFVPHWSPHQDMTADLAKPKALALA